MRLANYLRDRIRERDGFELIVEVSRCFLCCEQCSLLHVSRIKSTPMFVSGTFHHVCGEYQ